MAIQGQIQCRELSRKIAVAYSQLHVDWGFNTVISIPLPTVTACSLPYADRMEPEGAVVPRMR